MGGKRRNSCVPVTIRGRSYPPRTTRKVCSSSMTNFNTRCQSMLTANSGSKSHGDIVQGRPSPRISGWWRLLERGKHVSLLAWYIDTASVLLCPPLQARFDRALRSMLLRVCAVRRLIMRVTVMPVLLYRPIGKRAQVRSSMFSLKTRDLSSSLVTCCNQPCPGRLVL